MRPFIIPVTSRAIVQFDGFRHSLHPSLWLISEALAVWPCWKSTESSVQSTSRSYPNPSRYAKHAASERRASSTSTTRTWSSSRPSSVASRLSVPFCQFAILQLLSQSSRVWHSATTLLMLWPSLEFSRSSSRSSLLWRKSRSCPSRSLPRSLTLSTAGGAITVWVLILRTLIWMSIIAGLMLLMSSLFLWTLNPGSLLSRFLYLRSLFFERISGVIIMSDKMTL